jgi:hypothetical protein
MAVGTYFLADRETQAKEGKVHLFRVVDNDTSSEPGSGSDCLYSIAELNMSAVFDIKWRPRVVGTDSLCMGVARADSCVAIVEILVRSIVLATAMSSI